LRTWELTPEQFNVDPSTGSIVVLDVHTGGVLASVSYPTYDNSKLVNVIDINYFNRLNTNPAHPQIYRALMEARAPGSTIKMVSAVTALEMGTIGANTSIVSTGHFRIADERNPLPCWNIWGHGRLNVTQALAVSCNVFFAEAIFRIGNNHGHATRNTLDTIEILNNYMAFFGLHEETGAELWEHAHSMRRSYSGSLLASPELNKHIMRNPQALWLDAYTAQVAIGQHISNYTPAQMARVMMGFANQKAPYPLHFVRQVDDRLGRTIVDRRNAPEMEEPTLEISDATWATVIEGMRLATEGSSGGHRGTAVGLFGENPLPIQIAGKTGTAEELETRFEHTAFGAFAPLHDPQIAVYVNIPFSSASRMLSQISARVAKDVSDVALFPEIFNELAIPFNTVRP